MGLFIRVHSFCDSTWGFLIQHFVHISDCENSTGIDTLEVDTVVQYLLTHACSNSVLADIM